MRAAIVPLKELSRAKSRLTAVLAEHRAGVAAAMAQDVLAAVMQAGFDVVVVVTRDEALVRLAAEAGAVVALEATDSDLDTAVRLGFVAARRSGADTLVVIPGDVPLIDPGRLRAVVDRYETFIRAEGSEAIALAPCQRRDGTNLLCLTSQSSFVPTYGAGSFGRHTEAARLDGRSVLVLEDPSLALDVDEIQDLEALRVAIDGGRHTRRALERADGGQPISAVDALRSARASDPAELALGARRRRDKAHGVQITYSKKVFLPLTHLCRDACRYCTFAQTPRRIATPFMSEAEAVAIARRGAELGCKEALFTLGDQPEARYRIARNWLEERGFASTLDYVAHVAAAVLRETGLLPHINAGCMDPATLARMRDVAPSMGLMLESISPRLAERGGPHFGSPDKDPMVRLKVIEDAGRAQIPFTTGILVGIGETRTEIAQSLLAIRSLHERYGHIQEVIVQNFAPKPGTPMAGAPPASAEDFLWAVSMARLILPDSVSVQAPPNLSPDRLGALINAGINDWGGVSPLTPDHVNPEAPWPALDDLAERTAACGKRLVERLTVYPRYACDPAWVSPKARPQVLKLVDAGGLAREDDWLSGLSAEPPQPRSTRMRAAVDTGVTEVVRELHASGASQLGAEDIARLFAARGEAFGFVCNAADEARRDAVGETVTYVVNRNINYTNICTYSCSFCAFSKGPRKARGGDAPYLLDLAEVSARSAEARARGATEVCLQGGIHPTFDGRTYLRILEAVKAGAPDIHVHAFSPLEVTHGAGTLGLDVRTYLLELKSRGLGSLPGTAAEILNDPVRALICPDKLSASAWLEVVGTAHAIGLPTTSTMMFGHVDGYEDWAIHLLRLRDLQRQTGGFTEFVPLPFVAQEAPIFRKGLSRAGPTFREAVLVHAVARLLLHRQIPNIQTSWVKMGLKGAEAALRAGANDLGGVLMNESITRAAGAVHGQEMSRAMLMATIGSMGRIARQRTTLYGVASRETQDA